MFTVETRDNIEVVDRRSFSDEIQARNYYADQLNEMRERGWKCTVTMSKQILVGKVE